MSSRDPKRPAPPKRLRRPAPAAPAKPVVAVEAPEGSDRIAKVMARVGIASRRDAEKLILEGRVAVNGEVISSPALNVSSADRITVDGQPLGEAEPPRVWLYHKPAGLVTTAKDEQGRETVFDTLPEDLPRVMSIGRLDLNSEGLLLLTNDGELKRKLELPETGWVRKYRVRVKGEPYEDMLKPLREGVVVDQERFQPMSVSLDRQQGSNAWLTVGLREGKNREIRRAMESIGLVVNRLIRVSYGPFQLGDLEPGELQELRPRVLREQLGLEEAGPRAQQLTRTGRSGGTARTTPARAASGAAVDAEARGKRKPHARGSGKGPGKGAGPIRSKQYFRGDTTTTEAPTDRFEGGFGGRPQRGGDRGPRKSFGDKPGGDRGPRKPYGDRPQRDGDSGPRKSFGDKPYGDRGPRKPYGDRPQRDGDSGPRKSFGDKPGGDRGPRKPYGDRPQRDGDSGPRKSFGDKPYGDRGSRKPYGDRPQRDGDSGPRKSFGDKPYGDRGPRKSFGDKPGGDRGPRKPYGDKPGGDRGPRKPYGDRPQRDGDSGPRKSFGDKPYGDRGPRKPYGDKPGGDRGPRKPYGDRPDRPRSGPKGGAPRGGKPPRDKG